MTDQTTSNFPKYVIINDTDAPQPNMVCQWVAGTGYCYLDRRDGKERFDGMAGSRATPVEAFGWAIAEDEDVGSWVRFYRSDRPSTATYSDGEPRRWQHRANYFEYKRLSTKVSA